MTLVLGDSGHLRSRRRERLEEHGEEQVPKDYGDVYNTRNY
jgi:hypothetical protein